MYLYSFEIGRIEEPSNLKLYKSCKKLLQKYSNCFEISLEAFLVFSFSYSLNQSHALM